LCVNEYEVGKAPVWETEVELSPDWVRAKAGWDISDDEMKTSLEGLELEVRANDSGLWRVVIPSHRGDLHRPIDLVEEVLRMYGTDQIPASSVVATAMARSDNPITVFNRRSSDYLVGQHFCEAVNYTLRSYDEQKNWSSSVSADALALKNPISEDQTQLRHSLIPGLLDALRTNQQRKTGATRFFEVGRTFQEIEGKVLELVSVGFAEASEGEVRSWKARTKDDYYAARKRIETIAGFAGIDLSRYPLKPVQVDTTAWQEEHSAVLDEPRAGVFARIGLMNLNRVKEMDVQGEVIAGMFSILPERLREQKRVKFKPFSLFPPSSKDLALVVNQRELASVVVSAVKKIATKAAKGFELEDVAVFDVYEGSGLQEGKKSIAVSMTFRSAERTLKDKEVNQAFEAIQKGIREKTDYEIRD
ncbi:MAG: hypothetical protein AAGB46_07570, partial [Verrucomicrobiota bacterium]